MNKKEISACIREELALVLEKDPNLIDENENFMKLGLSSVQSLKVVNRIRKKLDMDINPVAMFEFKSVSKFAEFLSISVSLKELPE